VAVEIADVSKLDVEPGELPEKMAAWVIRPEREGEPKDAFQVEEIDVPEPGPFEVRRSSDTRRAEYQEFPSVSYWVMRR